MDANEVSDDRGTLYRVAYEEAIRGLSAQQEAIDGLRSRAGLLLSAAAVTTSFLGAEALQGAGLSMASIAGLISFVGVAISNLAIMWPRGWELAADPGRLVEGHIATSPPVSLTELHRALSSHMRDSYARNRLGIEFLNSLFQVASALLTVEVVMWIVAIALAL